MAAGQSSAELVLQVDNLRNRQGTIQVCVIRASASFPDCRSDPAAIKATVPADQAGRIALGPVPLGTVAVAIIHDQNGNGRLDTMIGIPKEGFGFSRDAPARFGRPRFAEAAVQLHPGANPCRIRVRYLL